MPTDGYKFESTLMTPMTNDFTYGGTRSVHIDIFRGGGPKTSVV